MAQLAERSREAMRPALSRQAQLRPADLPPEALPRAERRLAVCHLGAPRPALFPRAAD
jgi:hypothetical protein